MLDSPLLGLSGTKAAILGMQFQGSRTGNLAIKREIINVMDEQCRNLSCEFKTLESKSKEKIPNTLSLIPLVVISFEGAADAGHTLR